MCMVKLIIFVSMGKQNCYKLKSPSWTIVIQCKQIYIGQAIGRFHRVLKFNREYLQHNITSLYVYNDTVLNFYI